MNLTLDWVRENVFQLLVGIGFAIGSVLLLGFKDLDQLNTVAIAFAVLVVILLFIQNKRLLAIAVAFLVPFSTPIWIGSATMSVPAEPLLALLSIGLFGWITSQTRLDKRIFTHPLTILLLLDLGWMIIASTFSSHVIYSYKRVAMRAVFLSGAYLMMIWFFKDPKAIIKFFYLYGIACVLVALNVLNKHAHYDFNHHYIAFATKPYFSDHTVYSACITVAFLFLLVISIRARKIGFSKLAAFLIQAVTSVLFIAIMHASSRASWLSLIVVAGFAIAVKFKISIRGILLSLGSIALIILVFQNDILEQMHNTDAKSRDKSMAVHFQSIGNIQTDNSNIERLNRWTCALRMFQERPLFGWGPGTYQYEYAQFQSRGELTWISTFHGDKGNAHSEYLTYLSESGLIGLLIFLGWVFFSIHLGLKLVYNHPTLLGRTLALGLLLGLISFYVHGGVNAFIDQDKMAVLVFAALAGLVGLELNGRAIQDSNRD
ncbi:MAG: putative inorganic carbon (HCO3(-)) transporter [Granulosicoccus sp.]|jgi:putative inorganic carbon (HCO3(-)) transporter